MQSTQPRRRRVQAKHLVAVFGLGAVVAAGVTLTILTPADSTPVGPAGHSATNMGQMPPMNQSYVAPQNPTMVLGSIVAETPTTTTTATTTMSMPPGMHMPGM